MNLADKTFLEQAGLQILLAASIAAKQQSTNSLVFDGLSNQLEIEELLKEALNPDSLTSVLSSVTNYLSVRLDLAQLRNIVSESQDPNSKYNINILIRELVSASAPYAMFRSLFGLTVSQWRSVRSELGMANNQVDTSGRPPAADVDQEVSILEIFSESIRLNKSRNLGYAFLEVHQQTDINMKTIWHFIISEIGSEGGLSSHHILKVMPSKLRAKSA